MEIVESIYIFLKEIAEQWLPTGSAACTDLRMGLCSVWEGLTSERGSSGHLVFTPGETKPVILELETEVISGTTITNEKAQKR